MPKREASYSVAKRGWATAYAEAEQPPDTASVIRNRFINVQGAAEKRQGIVQRGDTISGTPTVTGIHQLVKKDGSTVLMVSGAGAIYRENGSTWDTAYTGLDSSAILLSAQFGDKLIFVNGVDRVLYTEDGVAFRELIALLEQGTTGSTSNSTQLTDADITNWIAGTNVAINDLVENISTGGYGVVTAVASATVTHTNISVSAQGIGRTASLTQTASQLYRIHDLVELNIVSAATDMDNVATATTGTNASVVAVSGLTFSGTEILTGDYIYNSTRAAVTKVLSVSANVRVTDIANQTSGDSLVFLKSAMPVASYPHVHFGRLYLVDARDQRKIRISGANDPQDMTEDAGTLDAISFNIGGLQPTGETVKAIGSFQKFLIFASERNIFAYSGTNPIGSAADFVPVGLFPQGAVSRFGLASLGNDMAFVSHDGLQGFGLIQNSSNLQQANLSEPIRPTLREAVNDTPEDEIVLVHYPQRSWMLLKVGTTMYCYSYSVFVGDPNTSLQQGGAWSYFDGLFAQQRAYAVLKDNSLVCAGVGGKVYNFDTGVYADAGTTYTTQYRTPWLSLDGKTRTVRLKQGLYVKPIFDAAGVTYTVRAEAPFNAESTDTITVPSSGGAAIGDFEIGVAAIGGSGVKNQKYPLRWRGEVARFTFETDDQNGPDTMSRFTVYCNVLGRE